MIKIAHFADVHVRNIERHEEYEAVFQKIYKKLTLIKPDRIVIAGDLFENFIEISNEADIIASKFLNNLAKIAKVIITRGNHDIRKKNINRVDSVETIVTIMDNPNITYLNKSDFFPDNDITWVVYEHTDKNNDPWLNKVKDDKQIYIGLFHDPIQNSSTDVGKVFNDTKLKDINYFNNNDYLFLGDIHKRQFFRDNKSAAYCGSTIQQDHGEKIEKHGFLLWNIESATKFTVDEIDIANDHTFVNFYIEEMCDYDNLNLTIKNIGKDPEIKVHWTDYSSSINTVNEKKIRDYIKTKYNTNKVKFDKTYIYTDVVSSKMLSESLDLTDLKVQLDIFKEYLQEQKYKKEDIEEILKIDDIINKRLHLSNTKTNIEWSIDKFWFNNFKSYGDDNEVDWMDVDGIYQIHGINKQGKTTMLDAITYILYGKTTTTLSPEKFGDSRYINNKRDLDYCNGGAIINVDGEKFVIQRKTERVWNKNRTAVTSCPTTLDYYESEIISDDNKLTGEVKKKTQQQLDLILGELKDFIRLSFTNADNLNDALSETRSIFMDNIIRDAGYDVFEIKTDEFKEYKKELNEEKLVINIQESEDKIKDLKIDISDLKQETEENNYKISKFEIELKEHNISRDDLYKKLNNIDPTMSSFDENLNLNSIENYNNKINDAKIQTTILDGDIALLPLQFDFTNLNNFKIKLKETNDKISERKDEISKMKNLNVESDNKIDKVLSKIKELKDSEIKKFQLKISENDLKIEVVKNQKENIVNEEIRIITSQIQDNELNKSEVTNNMKLLQKDGANLKNTNDELDIEIENLKNSTSCSACGRAFDKNDPDYSEHLAHLEDKINQLIVKKEDNNNKIQNLLTEYKKLKSLLPNFEETDTELKLKKDNLRQGIFSDEIKDKLKIVGSIKLIKEENLILESNIKDIENDNFENTPTLKENISKGEQLIKGIEKTKEDNLQVIKNIESELRNFNIENIENNIQTEENLRDKFELRKQKVSQKDNLLLSVENFVFKIKELQSEIDKYQEYKSKIEENKEIQISIDVIDEKISTIKDSIKELEKENNEIDKNVLLKETDIDNISVKIRKYLNQKRKEELLKEYQKCISRDGLPTFLLKKSIHIINKELNELLTNVDFTLFFDENLVLRMSSDDRLDVSQNAIESSGMERTFCALALKIALRQINVKSKSTFIFMDEIMGKLIDESVQQFLDFLEDLKSRVKKIIIIEHIHPINYDGLIEVSKSKDLISSLELRY